MATYTSSYTGAEIDAGIGYATPYTYSTNLNYPTNKTGTINNATDLIAALTAKAPIVFQIGSGQETRFYYSSVSAANYKYIGQYNDGLGDTIYYMLLYVNVTTVTWTLEHISIPTPTSADNGQVLAATSTDGDYDLVTITPGMTNPMTAAADLIVGGTSGAPTRLAKGTAGQVLKVNSGATALEWSTDNGMTNPMTTQGDLIVGGSSGTPVRLAKGTSGQILTSNGTTAAWAAPATPSKVTYTTTAPSANNPDANTLAFVVLTSEPSTKYSGYVYIITST